MFSVDLMEHSHDGKSHRGLVFWGVKSRLLVYFILVIKVPTL